MATRELKIILTVLLGLGLSSCDIERNRRIGVAAQARNYADKIVEGVDVDEHRGKLIQMADGDREFDAGYAISELGRIRDNSEASLDCILRALRSDSHTLNKAGTLALIRIKSSREDIIEELIKNLDQEGKDISWYSAEALGAIGSSAIKALPKLKEKVNSRDKLLAEGAKIAVSQIKGESIEVGESKGNFDPDKGK